jgi:hypothetical protein
MQSGKEGLTDTRYACARLTNACAIRQYEGLEHSDIQR